MKPNSIFIGVLAILERSVIGRREFEGLFGGHSVCRRRPDLVIEFSLTAYVDPNAGVICASP